MPGMAARRAGAAVLLLLLALVAALVPGAFAAAEAVRLDAYRALQYDADGVQYGSRRAVLNQVGHATEGGGGCWNPSDTPVVVCFWEGTLRRRPRSRPGRPLGGVCSRCSAVLLPPLGGPDAASPESIAPF